MVLEVADSVEPKQRPRDWGFFNAPVSSYEESFKYVLQGQRLPELIAKRSNPIVIDLMAPPGTVHDLLEPYPSGRGLAVSLPDHDIGKLPPDIAKKYQSDQITWLSKDVTDPTTWEHITEWLHGEKAHLIMERAVGGLDILPQNIAVFESLVQNSWDNVNADRGILLFETPKRDVLKGQGISIASWVDELRKGFNVNFDPGQPHADSNNMLAETGKIMITRSPNSPSVLPSLQKFRY